MSLTVSFRCRDPLQESLVQLRVEGIGSMKNGEGFGVLGLHRFLVSLK